MLAPHPLVRQGAAAGQGRRHRHLARFAASHPRQLHSHDDHIQWLGRRQRRAELRALWRGLPVLRAGKGKRGGLCLPSLSACATLLSLTLSMRVPDGAEQHGVHTAVDGGHEQHDRRDCCRRRATANASLSLAMWFESRARKGATYPLAGK